MLSEGVCCLETQPLPPGGELPVTMDSLQL